MLALHAPDVTPCSGQASTVMSSAWKHMLLARDLAGKHMPYAPRKIIALSEHMQTGICAGRECTHMHQESNCSQQAYGTEEHMLHMPFSQHMRPMR
jgi:hypothetical protein